MANQLKMAEVSAIVALVRQGWSYRRIARELGVDRDTVSRHARQAAVGSKPAMALTGAGGCDAANAAMALPGNGQVKAEANAAIALTGTESSKGAINGSRLHLSSAWPWREAIERKLAAGLSAQRIYQDLLELEHGYAGSYHSVRRLVAKLTARVAPPVRRMECPAGQEAQVDFGRGAPIIGPDGKRKSTWVLRVVLSHSRKGYSESVLRQSTDEFLRCLENAFYHFGGAPRTLVIDNLKAAVSRADWFDPELCPKVRSFAEHYGIAILPTKPYTPRHKGKIENGIKYVKNNALKGRSFASLAEENHHLSQWEATIADRRIHGTTRQQVIGVFNTQEKPALLPLPAGRFELFSEALRSVHRDGHVQVQGAYYSAPPEYLGQQIWARWDGRMVRLFDSRMRPIAVHAQQPPGRFATLSAHILPEKINSIERGTGWLLERVGGIGPQAQSWAEAMLQNRGIAGVRVLQGLLSLLQKHPRQAVDRACQVALGHEAWHLRSLRQLITHQASACTQNNFEFASQHEIIRPVADYGRFVREALGGQANQQECAV